MRQKRLVRGFAAGTVLVLALAGASTGAEENGGKKSVQSLNGLSGKLTLAAGTGTSITMTGSKTLTIRGMTLPFFDVFTGESGGGIYIQSTGGGNTGAIVGVNTGSGGTGVSGTSVSGNGVWGQTTNGVGVYGSSSGSGYAGSFDGNVEVTGTLSKGGGSFKIDHPLDPENKYLYHSFVESPDMKNIYDGTIVLDRNGDATVELPEWFEALNRDFRYQLTCIGGFAPVFVRDEISGNRFTIAGGLPGMRVCWQITGTRKDPFANAHRIPVEEEKSAAERGYYLHPDAYGQPDERGIQWTQRPDLMRQLRDSQR